MRFDRTLLYMTSRPRTILPTTGVDNLLGSFQYYDTFMTHKGVGAIDCSGTLYADLPLDVRTTMHVAVVTEPSVYLTSSQFFGLGPLLDSWIMGHL
jgi:hypothetical protein